MRWSLLIVYVLQLTIDDNEDIKYDATVDMKEEEEMLVKYREERLHVMFPDEIDTPVEVTARNRFQKYITVYFRSSFNTFENV